MKKVPCAYCGKIVDISFANSGQPQYCDKFCRAKGRVTARRNGNPSIKTTSNPRRAKIRRCGGCGH